MLVAGIIGTVLALWLYDNFVGWLSFLNATLPPVGAIIIVDYILDRRVYAQKVSPTLAPGAMIGIIAGGLAGWFIPVGIGALNAMTVAVLCYLIGRRIRIDHDPVIADPH